ncbi:UNVERIFIED_CONTAM: RNA-directed DNA polymerase [Sesamum latifolium]|uniref:RNA-directed DNA polymerase n=1 Tax=Sesamum latifolium TaxID=2727402 RepID=A0AAW2WSN9_9LAMI
MFPKKADGSLRVCCNYWVLNKITVKNKYPIPLVADCFDHLSRAKYFTKIELSSDYWQVRIKEGDEAKTIVVTSLANYYRCFVKGYSEIARPMTDLLKKTDTCNWTPQCQVAIYSLKRAMVTNLILALPDMLKPFMVDTDASDFGLGGVLMQDGHPVAFESRKLKDVEQRY